MRGDPPFFLSHGGQILPGRRVPLAVASPAAGAEWSVVVPGGRQWRLLGAAATFTASAAVANRILGIALKAAGVTDFVGFNTNAIAASGGGPVAYSQSTAGAITALFGTLIPVPFVPIWLTEGDTVSSRTVAIDVADTYTGISLLVEEVYFDNAELRGLASDPSHELRHLIGA